MSAAAAAIDTPATPFILFMNIASSIRRIATPPRPCSKAPTSKSERALTLVTINRKPAASTMTPANPLVSTFSIAVKNSPSSRNIMASPPRPATNPSRSRLASPLTEETITRNPAARAIIPAKPFVDTPSISRMNMTNSIMTIARPPRPFIKSSNDKPPSLLIANDNRSIAMLSAVTSIAPILSPLVYLENKIKPTINSAIARMPF